VLLLASVAVSDDYTWDQTNDTFSPGSGYGIISASPIGQEFLPGLNSLEVVQLQICNPTGIAHLLVSIYSDTITGTLIASSDTVSISSGYDDIVTFLFNSAALVPATQYVMAVAQIDGDSFVRCANSSSSTYLWGRLILAGTPEENEDFWFREGILGSALEGFTWGSIKNLSW
jgi:hypothetical protein